MTNGTCLWRANFLRRAKGTGLEARQAKEIGLQARQATGIGGLLARQANSGGPQARQAKGIGGLQAKPANGIHGLSRLRSRELMVFSPSRLRKFTVLAG